MKEKITGDHGSSIWGVGLPRIDGSHHDPRLGGAIRRIERRKSYYLQCGTAWKFKTYGKIISQVPAPEQAECLGVFEPKLGREQHVMEEAMHIRRDQR